MDQVLSRRLAAVLCADIAGYSALVGADESGTIAALRGHQAAVNEVLTRHGGRVVDLAGDGLIAEFPSTVSAVEGTETAFFDEHGQADAGQRSAGSGIYMVQIRTPFPT